MSHLVLYLSRLSKFLKKISDYLEGNPSGERDRVRDRLRCVNFREKWKSGFNISPTISRFSDESEEFEKDKDCWIRESRDEKRRMLKSREAKVPAGLGAGYLVSLVKVG